VKPSNLASATQTGLGASAATYTGITNRYCERKIPGIFHVTKLVTGTVRKPTSYLYCLCMFNQGDCSLLQICKLDGISLEFLEYTQWLPTLPRARLSLLSLLLLLIALVITQDN
jgi:hypothetical protein